MAGNQDWGDFSSTFLTMDGLSQSPSNFNLSGFQNSYDDLASVIGFQGKAYSPKQFLIGGEGESGSYSTTVDGSSITPEFLDAVQNLRFDAQNTSDGRANVSVFGDKGGFLGQYLHGDKDSGFDKLMSTLIPVVIGGGFGGGLASLFGGGALGGAMGHGLASGSMSSMQGGDFGKGFLSGAVGGGLNGMAAGVPAVMGNNPSAYVPASSGTSIAGAAGVTNPTLAGMVNRGAGSALGSLAAGKSGSEVLQSGLTGAALSGLNSAGKGAMDFYKNSLNSWLGGSQRLAAGSSDMDFDALQGSGGDMSGQTDVSPNRYDEMLTGSDGMSTYNPDYGFGGDQLANTFSSGLSPQKSIQSAGQSAFSLPSILGDAGRGVGNFALNNAGDLASMLYGFYNNRRQQKALGQQISSLQGLYGQNSPYAQQLRNTLNAKAAAGGRRSNVAGRETQLQAQLADRAASMAPTLMQLNQAQGGLKNNNMNMLLQGVNKLGGFNAIGKGLGSLFGPSTTTIPYNNGNVSGSDVFGWKGAGGM